MEKVAVLVGTKGRGSNMRALVEAGRTAGSPFQVVLVVAPASGAPALEVARSLGVPTAEVSATSPKFGTDLERILADSGVQWLCLAGFLRLVPAEVLDAFPRRVLNIHPALLPRHGGSGMFGMRVHRAVLAAGDRESGCTVHYVDAGYDEGEPILQLRCPVEPGDDPGSLAARVLELEHQTYPQALRMAIERARAS